MQVHNPLSQSRLCVELAENLEAFEVRDVPSGFKPCADCRCVVSEEKAAAKVAKAAEAKND